jgi:hypothetical protein
MSMRFNSSDRAPVELSGGGRFVLARKDFVFAYLNAFEQGVLQRRAMEGIEALRSSRICPDSAPVWLPRMKSSRMQAKEDPTAVYRSFSQIFCCAAMEWQRAFR